jgi:hypothetical protein
VPDSRGAAPVVIDCCHRPVSAPRDNHWLRAGEEAPQEANSPEYEETGNRAPQNRTRD